MTEMLTSRGDVFDCPQIFIARRHDLVPFLFGVACIA